MWLVWPGSETGLDTGFHVSLDGREIAIPSRQQGHDHARQDKGHRMLFASVVALIQVSLLIE